MKRINNIKIYKDLDLETLIKYVCKKYHIIYEDILDCHIIKKSIDARDKNNIHYLYNIALNLKNEKKYSKLDEYKEFKLPNINISSNNSLKPIIIGAGPSGLFAALTFIKNGIKPIIIEQGKKVEDRKKDVDLFIKTGKLNINSNIQFGEGGAGTFSDGKLTSGINNPLCNIVLQDFHKFGAPKQILYLSKPHIGTDNLIKIISNIRSYIIENGGQFLFNSKLTDLHIKNNKIQSITYVNDNKEYNISASNLILAIGHSSRDTFYKIYNKGLHMESKNFSVGVRIEHLQKNINLSQYGNKTTLKLPPAEYKLVYHDKSTNRSCYSFCMCPGGVVVAAASEEGRLVSNGMSYHARDLENANSALVVTVKPDDFEGNSPLKGMEFQRKYEEMAYKLGGGNYKAPIQLVGDFLKDKPSEKLGSVKPSYKPGFEFRELKNCLPSYVIEALREGIVYFDKKIKGYAMDDAVLTGIETRTSAPVRINRNENLESINVNGVYPTGEGAGFAGGIISAAVDGIKVAERIMAEFK